MSEASHDLNRLLDKPGLGEGPAGYENSFLSFTGAQRLLNGVLSLALVAVMTFRPWVRWRGRFGSISSCARPNASLGLLVPKAGTGRRRSSHRHGSGGYIGWSVTPWGCGPDPRSQDPHRAAAVETGERRTRADRGDGAAGVDPEQEVQQLDQALAVGVEKAEVARAAQPLGQDMAQQQVQEVGARERSGLPAAGAAVLEAEGHLAVVAGEDVLLPDHARDSGRGRPGPSRRSRHAGNRPPTFRDETRARRARPGREPRASWPGFSAPAFGGSWG